MPFIGGISGLRGSWKNRIKESIREFFKRPYILGDKCFQSEMRRRRKIKEINGFPNKASSTYTDAHLYTRALRKPLAIFFSHFFRSLFDGTPKPQFELDDKPLRKTIEKATKTIRELYNEEYGS